jgi:glutaminyl-tRNA synthetase
MSGTGGTGGTTVIGASQHSSLPELDGGAFAFAPRTSDRLRPIPWLPHAMTTAPDATPASDFIRDRIRADLQSGKVQQVITRFPPEPNGYLHIGHAKAITLSFSVAKEFGGRCNLRMDDTNPAAEDQEYVDAIKEDVRWLGFAWDAMFYAADYFDQIYAWAEQLVEKGLAYVDDQNADQIAATRGTLTTPGIASPCRGRAPARTCASCAR